MARIEGKVAQVLTNRELVLNVGEDQGVEVGMRFAVLNSKGISVTDPDTGEEIGSVELPKTVVKIVRTQERLSIGRTFRTVRTKGGPLAGLPTMEMLSAPPRTVVETLRTDESRAKDELDEKDSYIKIGDIAVQIVDQEYE